MSQPTLSIAVRKLEEELGVELFERTKTKVQPTLLGERIVAQARVLLAGTGTIKALADAGKNQLSSPLALGSIFTMGPYLLPQLIPYLQQQAPAMPLYVQEDYTANLRKKLRDGVLDVILVSLPFSDTDVVTQELFEEPLVVVMPQAHPLARKNELVPADIARDQLLLPGDGHCLREQVLALHPAWQGERDGQARRYRAEGNSLETLRYMVAAGLGVSVLPGSAAEAGLCATHRLVVRPLKGASRKLALAWRASFPRHKAIEVLRKSIQTCSGAYWSFTTEPDAQDEQTLLPLQRW